MNTIQYRFNLTPNDSAQVQPLKSILKNFLLDAK